MSADFSTYLKAPMDKVPENFSYLPAGHFFATIAGWKTAERDYDKATGGAPTPVVEITFKITAADDDVDPDTLPPGEGVGMIGTIDYKLNDPGMAGQISIRRLAEKTCELPVKGYELEDVLNELKGQEVKVFSAPRADKKEEGRFYTNLTKVLSATA